MKTKKLYICDPNLNKECSKTNCHINGGPCIHTVDPENALIGTQPIDMNIVEINEEESPVERN